MNSLLHSQLVHNHGAELRRSADAYRLAHRRCDTACHRAPRLALRASAGALLSAVALLVGATGVAAAGASGTGPTAAGPAPPATPTSLGASVVQGEVIVKYKADAARSQRAEARRQLDATFKRELLLEDAELVQVPKGSEQAAAAAFARRSDVEYAEPNRMLREQATPNDARFSELWGLHNSGQTVEGVAGTADADIDAPEAWNMGAGLGPNVRVAVVDTGVAANHPDLAANMLRNPGESGAGKETNGVDDDANGLVDDYRGWDFIDNDNNPADHNGHGTHVAGTIAGRSNTASGVAGVASFPTASGQWLGPKLLAVRVLGPAGGSVAQIADGLVYAGTMGAKVANVSLGGDGASATLDNAIRSKPNTLYVVAAGNDGSDGVGDNNDTSPNGPCTPASMPDAVNKLCVAATDSKDALARFSNFGPVNVDLAAPGVSTLSTVSRKAVFSDDFETDIAGRWTTTDAGQRGTLRWGRSTLWSPSPSHSLSDSPGTATQWAPYENNQDTWARNSAPIDLTGGSDCTVTQDLHTNTMWVDRFTIEATRTPTVSSSWQEIYFNTGWNLYKPTVELPAAFDGRPGIFIRYRLWSNFADTWDGVYIDNVAVTCFKTSGLDASSYGFKNGTSMAAPHVAGAAVFLFTRFPTATVTQIKDKLLRSVDRKASLDGKVATGGRLNLYKAAAESTAGVTSGVLRYTAGAGQTNNVTVTRFTDTDGIAKYRVADPYSASPTAQQSGSRINPGAGCAAIDDNTVTCPVAGITRIALTGGDLDDTLDAATIAIPVTLGGGAGQDVLTGGTADDSLTGGTEPDRFAAGAGNDTINSRNEDVDTQFSCGESTGDNDRVYADLDPIDPVTASPTDCEVVSKL